MAARRCLWLLWVLLLHLTACRGAVQLRTGAFDVGEAR
jgi:hypothetical protein